MARTVTGLPEASNRRDALNDESPPADPELARSSGTTSYFLLIGDSGAHRDQSSINRHGH
jgi:hypothetical protein